VTFSCIYCTVSLFFYFISPFDTYIHDKPYYLTAFLIVFDYVYDRYRYCYSFYFRALLFDDADDDDDE